MSDPTGGTGEKQTFVEEGTQFKGSLTSSCPIVVRGKIEGDLQAPALTVSPSGAVKGQVKVGEMHSQGELAGEFDADVVRLSGTVKDNTVIRAKSLEVKLEPPEGRMQVIFGECALEVGEMPSKDKDKDKDKDVGGKGKKKKDEDAGAGPGDTGA
jgi:cytoskeletal protein CcmA (bactofilin family)